VRRHHISSSVLASIGYESSTRTLEAEFKTGKVYWYLGVPESVYLELLHAESHGAYFNMHIRDVYDFRLVSE
jgi:hypothetical protein